MVRNDYLVWLLIGGLLLISCKDQNKTAASELKDVTSRQDSAGKPPVPRPAIEGGEVELQRFMLEMKNRIADQRQSTRPLDAGTSMKYLFSVWEPTGKTVEQLYEVIGTPTNVDSNGELRYVLWDELKLSGWVYEFKVKKGRIISFSSTSTE